ncbi:MAG: glycosyltransferase family 9 protein [Nanoarchaeota archaeon]|nr:glycosyltransferase family 9 protein [Nanoarchaeota archaeon]
MANIKIIKFLDRAFGSILCLILSVFSGEKEIDVEKSKKILFIQLWSLGETILTLPAIASVKNKYRNSDIYVLATGRNKEVYLSADLDINILTVKLNPISIIRLMIYSFKKFDIVIDLEEYLNISALIAFFLGKQRIGFSGKLRSHLYNKSIRYNDKQHVAKTFLELTKLIGANYKDKNIIRLNYGKNEKDKVKDIFNKIPKNSRIIGIVPGAAESSRSRMWPAERYTKLSNLLIRKFNCFLVLIGSDKEKEITENIAKNIKKVKEENKVINIAGNLSVKELFCLIDNLDLLITNDTGPIHIASAQQTKAIGLYGPNTPIRFGPYHKDSSSLYKPESCKFSPCINVHKGIVPNCLYPKNSKDYQKCMKAIEVEDVLMAVGKLI